MEPTNVPRIKRHFVKRSFGNSIFPAHWKKKKKTAQKDLKRRGEKKSLYQNRPTPHHNRRK